MNKSLLAGAIGSGTIAISTIPPTPLIGHRLDILILATTTSAVLWIDLWMVTLATRIQNGVGETRDEVHEYRTEVHEYKQDTYLGNLVRAAGRPLDDEPLLPTPRGDIRPIPADIDGETVLVGVDESTHLADVIELRRALADTGEAAQ